MADEKFLTVREVSLILGISEKEVMDLAESGRIPAYKVGGVYLRFQRNQIEEYRKSQAPSLSRRVSPSGRHSLKDRIGDLLYFYDFYILSALIIALILFIIFRGY